MSKRLTKKEMLTALLGLYALPTLMMFIFMVINYVTVQGQEPYSLLSLFTNMWIGFLFGCTIEAWCILGSLTIFLITKTVKD